MAYVFANPNNTVAQRDDGANVPWSPVAAEGPADKGGNSYRQWQADGSPIPMPYVRPTPAPRKVAPARLDRLYTALDKAAPGAVDTLEVDDWNNKATWRTYFNAAATQPQKDAVNSTIASYDYQAAEANDATRSAAYMKDADSIDMLDRLRNLTPAQIDNWVETNVTNIAGAQAAFKRIIKVLARIA